MTRLLIVFLFISILAPAQKALPRLENDTLYTASGFKIYTGQTLKFGKGSDKKEMFRYFKVRLGPSRGKFSGTSFLVNELKHFGVSQLNNSYIELGGTVTFKDNSKSWVYINLAFDNAIRSSELIVPADKYSIDMTIPTGQKNIPRFEKDTLHTLSGYKIYAGQTLKFGNGSRNKGNFAYIAVIYGGKNTIVPGTDFTIKDLNRFGVDDNMEAAIEMVGGIIYKDGSKGRVTIRVTFEEAIATSELIIPDQYKSNHE